MSASGELSRFVDQYGKRTDPIKTAMLGAAFRADYIKTTQEYREFITAMAIEAPNAYAEFLRIDRRERERVTGFRTSFINLVHDIGRALTQFGKNVRTVIRGSNESQG